MPNIGFLGTGLMGAHMVRNLLKAGYDVSVWNRTAAKAQALVADGATLADTPAAACKSADIVISMLSDGVATAEMLADTDVLAALTKGNIWIDMCSAKPAEARAQTETLAPLGVAHLDAPVSGGTKGAEAASLAIMAGGTAETFDAVKPVLAAMGRPVLVGPAGSGQLAKLANQAIVAITIGAVAEAMFLIGKGGGDADAVRAALKGGFADSTILQQHGARMTEGNFVPGGFSRLHLKDLNNALAEAEGLGLKLPMTADLQARFARLCGQLGGSELDHSAIFLELLDQNGMGGAAL